MGKDEVLMTPTEAAARLNISPVTLADWLRAGKLEGVKVGRLWRISETALQAFLTQGTRAAKV